MQIPEDLRCCICLSVSRRMMLTGCPHRLCLQCVEDGSLQACPVCQSNLPRPGSLEGGANPQIVDEEFAREAETMTLRCGCGEELPLFEAEDHTCEYLAAQVAAARQGFLYMSHGGSGTDAESGESGASPYSSPRMAPAPPPNRSTFTCPLCHEPNLSRQGLLEHCEKKHCGASTSRGRPVSAICPICASMPWGDPTFVSRDFLSHLKLRHRCDYETLTDFSADEEAMLQRALWDSTCEASLAGLFSTTSEGASSSGSNGDRSGSGSSSSAAARHSSQSEDSRSDASSQTTGVRSRSRSPRSLPPRCVLSGNGDN